MFRHPRGGQRVRVKIFHFKNRSMISIASASPPGNHYPFLRRSFPKPRLFPPTPAGCRVLIAQIRQSHQRHITTFAYATPHRLATALPAYLHRSQAPKFLASNVLGIRHYLEFSRLTQAQACPYKGQPDNARQTINRGLSICSPLVK